MTIRYAYIQNGQTVWGPGPNPYFITLMNGDIWELSAHTVEESEAKGIFTVTQIGKRDFDTRFEEAYTPTYSIVNGKPQETWSYGFIPTAKDNMLMAVDEHAEKLRQVLATQFPGQYHEYEEVYEEALKLLALPVDQVIPDGTYKYLEADVDVTYSNTLGRVVANIREAADLVVETRNNWRNAGATIRSARLATKRAINDAATIQAAFSIYNDYING